MDHFKRFLDFWVAEDSSNQNMASKVRYVTSNCLAEVRNYAYANKTRQQLKYIHYKIAIKSSKKIKSALFEIARRTRNDCGITFRIPKRWTRYFDNSPGVGICAVIELSCVLLRARCINSLDALTFAGFNYVLVCKFLFSVCTDINLSLPTFRNILIAR